MIQFNSISDKGNPNFYIKKPLKSVVQVKHEKAGEEFKTPEMNKHRAVKNGKFVKIWDFCSHKQNVRKKTMEGCGMCLGACVLRPFKDLKS